VRILVDQNLHPALADYLQSCDIEALHASELGMSTAEDPELFEKCIADDRVLLTADKKLTKFLAESHAIAPSVVLLRDFSVIYRGDLYLVSRLNEIESIIKERGNGVISIAPKSPIRVRLLPLGLELAN